MTIKPVDVFMNTGVPEGIGCPISVAAIFEAMLLGTFQEMDAYDLKRWTEIIYTGFVGEIEDVLVLLDAGPNSIIAMVNDGMGGSWDIELTGEFLVKNKR